MRANAYTRVLSVFHKAGIDENAVIDAPVVIAEDRSSAGRAPAGLKTLSVVAREGTPHVMCATSTDLAGLFSGFYEHCVLARKAARPATAVRLALLTAKTLKLGLDTLGIKNRRSVCNKQPGESRGLVPSAPRQQGARCSSTCGRYSVRQRIAIA
ncbi:hypothetical protein MJ563_17700 [Klebsiella pneumoniae]|nr:hypothetical protein MJ563_17700 [Klebsiella pneumoniae]